jgi:hypothetical protein
MHEEMIERSKGRKKGEGGIRREKEKIREGENKELRRDMQKKRDKKERKKEKKIGRQKRTETKEKGT